MGVAVFAGMLGVTLFGLLLTPVFYWVVRRLGAAVRRGNEPAPPRVVSHEQMALRPLSARIERR